MVDITGKKVQLYRNQLSFRLYGNMIEPVNLKMDNFKMQTRKCRQENLGFHFICVLCIITTIYRRVNMNHKVKTLISVLLFLPSYFLLYAFLHEAGHTLVILAYGGTIYDFVFWNFNAHVSSDNAVFTVFGEVLCNIAGMLLPTIIGAIALCFYKTRISFPGYHICYILGSVSLISSMIPWIIIPVISLFAAPPQGDDVTKFLYAVKVHPLFVSAGVLLLVGAFIFLVQIKGLLKKGKEFISIYRENIKQNRKSRVIILTSVLLLTTVLIVLYNFSKPTVVFSTSFAVDNVLEDNNRKYVFDIEKDKDYTIDMVILSQGIITAVRIIDENGGLVYQNLGEDISNSGMRLRLQRGRYTLSLTYLADYEAVVYFFEDTEQGEISAEGSNYFNEVFSHDTDHSARFSITLL